MKDPILREITCLELFKWARKDQQVDAELLNEINLFSL